MTFADQNDSKVRKRNCNSQGRSVSCGLPEEDLQPGITSISPVIQANIQWVIAENLEY
jgi:hypothetical protein